MFKLIFGERIRSGWPGAARLARRHGPIVLLLLAAAVLLLTNLGADRLWEDEADTALLGRSILRHGVPVAWDGLNFVAPDYGQRLTGSFVMVSHPWLQYYAAAASFAVFGESPWSARLPFALAGLGTILVVYAMTLRVAGSRAAALSAAALLVVNVQFLLFARQARNYSFNALLTCLLLWQFLRLRSWRSAALLAGIALLLFHTHPIGLAALAALGAATMLSRPFADARRWFWPAAAVVAVYAAPWLKASQAGYVQNVTPLADASTLLPRLLQFAVEWASVAPLVGLAALYVALRLGRRRISARPHRHKTPRRPRRRDMFAPEERPLLVGCAAVVLGETGAMALTHSRDMMWVVGLHHTPAIIPLTLVMAGVLMARVSGSRRTALAALLVVFACTRLGDATPWTFWAPRAPERDPKSTVSFHVPERGIDRVLPIATVRYAQSLVRRNPGVIARIGEYLREHAAPGDVVITNYAWEALYYDTGLPQGAKIDPTFPVYRAARAHDLPRYLFGPSSVRWIVWRPAWPAFFRTQDCERILRQLAAAGVRIELVRQIPETMYENRENVHFHRFSPATYVYPWYEKLPEVRVYRVDWPAVARGGNG